MPSWQSTFFTRFSRMAKPHAADASTDIAELRRQYTYLSDRFGAVPRDAVFEPAALGPVKGEWVRTETSSTRRLILYFHGGGYIAGSPETHRALVAKLAHAAEASAFSTAYRLAPEYAFPAAVRDGIDTYRQFVARGVAPGSIVLAGNGSGGGLALSVLLAIVRGEYQISGLSNRRMRAVLPDKTGGQIGRILKRLRLHGLIKKIGKTYKYYLTQLGQRAVLVGLKLKEHLIVPGLATASP